MTTRNFIFWLVFKKDLFERKQNITQLKLSVLHWLVLKGFNGMPTPHGVFYTLKFGNKTSQQLYFCS